MWDRWERHVLAFGRSKWSTVALLAFGAVWIGVEAMRGKWIGFDGAITIILGEIALATLRRK